jgi:tetratricopeptide (TPR) repeat protein
MPQAARTPRVLAGLLVLATACVFWPGTSGGFVWDDHLLIENNARLRSASELPTLLSTALWNTTAEGGAPLPYYRPVISLAYFAQFQLFGVSPRGYHVVSVLLHALCVLLVFGWLRARVASEASNASMRLAPYDAGAAAGAALFALHPTRTESVTWIAGCTDLWMTLFVLIAARLASGPRTLARDALTALSAALAVLSKEPALLLPLALGVDALALHTAGSAARRSALRATLAAGIGTASALALRLSFMPLPLGEPDAVLFGLPKRVLSSLGHYAEAIFVPLSPTVLRGKTWSAEDGSYAVESTSLFAGSALLGLCAALLVWRLVRRARLRRAGSAFTDPSVGDAAWLLLPLLPVLNITPLPMQALVADRFLYWPLLGAAALLARAVARTFVHDARAQLLLALLFLGLATCGAVVIDHGQAFASDRALWRYELARDPERPYVLERSAVLAIEDRNALYALQLALAGRELAKSTGRRNLEPRFLMLGLWAIRQATPDLEQERLLALRAFYEGLAHEGRATLGLPPLVIGGTERLPSLGLSVELTDAQRRQLDHDISGFAMARAELFARTREPERAEQLLVELLRADPRSADAATLLAIVRARLGRMAEAKAALAHARSVAPASGSVELTTRVLGGVERLMQLPAQGGALGAELRAAQLDLMLGAYTSARERLDALLASAPRQPVVIAMRVRVDALDQRGDLARERLDRARRELPQAVSAWDALAAELP